MSKGQKVQSGVYLRSVSKPILVIFGTEYRDEQTVKASLLFLKFCVSQFIQSQNY